MGLTSCAFAQTSQSRSNRADGGWEIAAYIGGARTADSDLTVSQPGMGNNLTFENVRLRSRSFDGPLYYGLRAGYYLPQLSFLGFESEFIHLKVFSDPQQTVRVSGQHRNVPLNREMLLGEIVQQYSISHGVNLLLFNIAARRRMTRDGRLTVTARAGIGPTLPHTESRIEDQAQEQYEIGRVGWQVSAGADLKLWRGLHLLGEYKLTRTRQRNKVSSGTAESLLRTHHGLFGFTYRFE